MSPRKSEKQNQIRCRRRREVDAECACFYGKSFSVGMTIVIRKKQNRNAGPESGPQSRFCSRQRQWEVEWFSCCCVRHHDIINQADAGAGGSADSLSARTENKPYVVRALQDSSL